MPLERSGACKRVFQIVNERAVANRSVAREGRRTSNRRRHAERLTRPFSVSISGDVLAVGASYEDSAATGMDGKQADNSVYRSGEVYVFRRSASGIWNQEVYLKASNTGVGDEFGASISISGDVLAVSAHGAANSGAGYVYRLQ